MSDHTLVRGLTFGDEIQLSLDVPTHRGQHELGVNGVISLNERDPELARHYSTAFCDIDVLAHLDVVDVRRY